MRLACILLALVSGLSCATRRGAGHFRVLPGNPDYLLRSPDSNNVRFPDVLASYTGLGDGWVDLRRYMLLRIDNAYFQTNAPEQTLKYYLGTEMARFRVAKNGRLRTLSLEPGLDQLP